MGQAKARGSFDARRQEGIAKREAEELRRHREKEELVKLEAEQRRQREALMTPEDRQRRHRSSMGMAMIQGLLVGCALGRSS